MMETYRLLFLCTLALILLAICNGKRRVCYYSRDSQKTPNKIDTTLCTHILFAFADVSTNGTLVPANPNDPPYYKQLEDLKKASPSLKIMVSVSSHGISTIAETPQSRLKFAKSVAEFLTRYNFDGIDLDWEFPGPFGKTNFVALLKEIYEMKFNNVKPIVSAAVSASLTLIIESYDIPQIAKYVDFVNIMCYDFNFFRDYFPLTGYNSPLFKRKYDLPFFSTWNIEWATTYWSEKGMPKEKMVVGLPTYGHTYTLALAKWHNVHDFAKGSGLFGGDINYPQICDFLKSGGIRIFDNQTMVPYAYKDKNWVSYEDEISMTYKAKWVVSQNFSGVMTWSLNSDDWFGNCNSTPFPLHNVLKNIVN